MGWGQESLTGRENGGRWHGEHDIDEGEGVVRAARERNASLTKMNLWDSGGMESILVSKSNYICVVAKPLHYQAGRSRLALFVPLSFPEPQIPKAISATTSQMWREDSRGQREVMQRNLSN